MKQRRIITCIALIALPFLLAAASREAAQSVQEGLESFEQGQFKAAADAFKKADVAVPNDARVTFDRGCAAAAAGDADTAIGLFQQASASTDPKLAAASRYCLGCLAAIKARKALDEKPEDAAPEVREEAIADLTRAVEHYRDTLKLDPQHEDARYNVETIRQWTKHTQELWRQRDRKKMRDGMQLLDYVLLLEKEQREIRTLAKSLAKQPDTPLLREQLDDVRRAQEYLSLEIEPLKEKVIAALTQPQGGQQGPGGRMMPGGPAGGSQPAVPAADVQKAVALLGSLADQARTEMATAADQLTSFRTPDAMKAQAAAVEMLDQIYMAMVPYPGLVKRAVDTQRELVDRTTRIVEPSKSVPQNDIDKSTKTTDDKTLAEQQPEVDLHEDAWDQRFVTRWSEVMVAKAKQGLKQMPPPEKDNKDTAKKDDAKPDQLKKDKKVADAKPASGLQDGAKPDPAAAAKKKMEGLRKSMQLAVELGPKVENLTDEAATHLDEEQPEPALPKQKEALRLLEEIAKPLQDENKQDQQQQQQNQQQQDNKDQKDKDQKNKDQKDKDQKDEKDQQDKKDEQKKNDQKKDDKDKKSQDKKEQDKKKDDKQKGDKDKKKDRDEKKKDKDKQGGKDKKDKDEKKQKMSPGDVKKTMDQKKAEAALRRARQRQQERREMQKAVEAQLYRSGTVEKDW